MIVTWILLFSDGSLSLNFLPDPTLNDFAELSEYFHVHDKVHRADYIFKGIVYVRLVLKDRQEMKSLVIVLNAGNDEF
jgi:hypothetical protein